MQARSGTESQHSGDRDDAAGRSAVEARLALIVQDIDFPALSSQIIATMTALDDEASSVQRLSNVVLREYSLTLRVIRTANSTHYRRGGRPIQSATQALFVLGARTVRHLASSLLLWEHYRRHSPGLRELMLLSLLTANHAREVALRLGLRDPEEAHLCGMFRNLGEVLIACHFPEDYARIHALMRSEQKSAETAANVVLGFRYEELGVAVSRHWGMPESLLTGVSADVASPSPLARITAFSHELTQAIYRRETEGADDVNEVIRRYAPQLKLTSDRVREVVEAALSETREVFSSASVTVDDLRLRRLSDAAVVALGGTPSETGEWGVPPAADADHVSDADLRPRLLREIEGAIDPQSGSDLSAVLLMALEAGLRGGPFDRAVALVLNPERTEVHARTGLGRDVEPLMALLHFPMVARGEAVVSLLQQRHATYIPVDRDPTREEGRWMRTSGSASFGIFPMVVRNRLVGCLYCDRRTPASPPDRAALSFLERLPALIVRAIDARRGGSEPTADEKMALVLRLLRGDNIDTVSEASGVDAARLEKWRQDFLAGALDRLAGS
ncbi:MAG: HDOD domain-containing protein [Gemmatimonadaceae bacterium]